MMKKYCQLISFCVGFCFLTFAMHAQCLSELLFIKQPDTLCANSKELVLYTSKAKEANVEYVWVLPNGTTAITTDSLLKIPKPQPMHSGSYSVFTRKDGCVSAAIGPVTVTVLGTASFADTVKNIKLCGTTETLLTSQFKTSSSIFGEWKATEGVEIENPKFEKTRVKNLNAGENLLIWVLSTDKCKAFYKDSFLVNVEVAPTVKPQIFELKAQNASLTLPLGAFGASNLNLIEDVELRVSKQPISGQLTIDGKTMKYSRKVGFSGIDQFSLVFCNKRCLNLCSSPTNFQIQVNYESQYPNVTVAKLLSPRQTNFRGWQIENVDDYPQNELHILNRWGGVIEVFKNYSNTAAWDGTQSGKLLPSGAYYFAFYAKSDKNTPPKTDFKPISGIFYIID